MFARHIVPVCTIGVLLLVSSCGPRDLGCESGYCGTAIIMQFTEASTLFPPTVQNGSERSLAALIFFPLADLGPDLNTVDANTFVPRLAQSWAFEDSLTLVFTMNPAARWQDGASVTARDVEFTFSVYTDTLVNSGSRGALASIERVTARDDGTVAFEFNRRHREMLYTATYHMRILPSHILDSIPRERLGGHDFASHPVGNGPYRFARWDAGQSIELRADTNFFLGRPGIPRIIMRFAADPNTIMTPLLSGDADVIEFIPFPETIAQVEENNHLEAIPYPPAFYGYMAFNFVTPGDPTKPHPLFNDANVRRAIAFAVDRNAVAHTAVSDRAVPPDIPVTPVSRVYQTSIPTLRYDTVEANKILDDSGWRDTNGDGVRDKNGRELAFELIFPSSSAPRTQSAAVLKTLLQQVGIRLNDKAMEPSSFFAAIARGDFDAYIGTWSVPPSPAGIPNLWTTTGIGSLNYGRYHNTVVDSLVKAAINEVDGTQEMQLWSEAFAEMNNNPGAIWLYTPFMVAAVHSRFENVSIRPDRWSATLWQWRVRDGEWLDRDIIAPTP